MAARFTVEVLAFAILRAMELLTILNHCHHHRGFVYHQGVCDQEVPEIGFPFFWALILKYMIL